jgi:hypothetical protein
MLNCFLERVPAFIIAMLGIKIHNMRPMIVSAENACD